MIRLFDIFFSAIGLLLLLPFFLIIYIVIRIESKGGGFYVQERIGKDEAPFGLYKFRTMRCGSDKKGLITVGEHDERITHFGYFLRRYKLDELPQLFNVLLGHMSFVGPRPTLGNNSIRFDRLEGDLQHRFMVKPGITGYAQAYFRNSIPQEQKFHWDAYYADHVGMLLDAKILFRTAFAVLREKNINCA